MNWIVAVHIVSIFYYWRYFSYALSLFDFELKVEGDEGGNHTVQITSRDVITLFHELMSSSSLSLIIIDLRSRITQ